MPPASGSSCAGKSKAAHRSSLHRPKGSARAYLRAGSPTNWRGRSISTTDRRAWSAPWISPHHEMPTLGKLLEGRRVLVVEDEMLVVMIIEDMLAELGCASVTAAGTVQKALTLI